MCFARLAVLFATLFCDSAAATEWKVLPQSRLWFEAEVEVPNGDERQPTRGDVREWHAEIIFDPADPAAARLDVVLDMTSLTSGSASFDQQMLGTGWFDVSNHPAARFGASGFKKTGPGYRTEGALELLGIAKPLTLDFALSVRGDTALAEGTAQVARMEYGIGARTPADLATARVTVRFRIVAKAAR
ncbi:MAG: YceI family protein [Pseudomonadota bacterium]